MILILCIDSIYSHVYQSNIGPVVSSLSILTILVVSLDQNLDPNKVEIGP